MVKSVVTSVVTSVVASDVTSEMNKILSLGDNLFLVHIISKSISWLRESICSFAYASFHKNSVLF